MSTAAVDRVLATAGVRFVYLFGSCASCGARVTCPIHDQRQERHE